MVMALIIRIIAAVVTTAMAKNTAPAGLMWSLRVPFWANAVHTKYANEQTKIGIANASGKRTERLSRGQRH